MENEIVEEIKNLLKNENGEELIPVASSYCEGENVSVHQKLSANDLAKIMSIIGDGLLDLTQDHPVQIKLITKEEDREASYNGNIWGNSVSPKIAFLEAHDIELSEEEWVKFNEPERHLTYQEASIKYGHLVKKD